MGDIISSQKYDGTELMVAFKQLVLDCNQDLGQCMLSPYTITLGDEFQGIAKSLLCSVQSLFYIEEEILRRELPFQLRYVVHYGEIDTPLNPAIAYGMVGPGLAKARELLTGAGVRRPRFCFDLPGQRLTCQLNRLFQVLASLMKEWRPKDRQLISDMLSLDRLPDIAARHQKTLSQIYKREKTLRIEDYKLLKAEILDICKEKDN
jgi:hypothetical protein